MAVKLFSANSVGRRYSVPKGKKKRKEKNILGLADFQLKKSMLEKNIAGG